jgi:hypothetical protein
MISTEPVLRTAEDEKYDQEQRVKNFLDGVYEDWPNDAGVSNCHEGPKSDLANNF